MLLCLGRKERVCNDLRKPETSVFVPSKRKSIAPLGAGGSARALLAGLAAAGASRRLICNRTQSSAQTLVDEFQPHFPETQIEAVTLESLQQQELNLLVNTTTVGMLSDESPLDLSLCRKVENVVDIIYRPAQTKLLLQAETMRIPAINGLGMLLYQGCDAFTFWTGQSAPESVMREQLLNQID